MEELKLLVQVEDCKHSIAILKFIYQNIDEINNFGYRIKVISFNKKTMKKSSTKKQLEENNIVKIPSLVHKKVVYPSVVSIIKHINSLCTKPVIKKEKFTDADDADISVHEFMKSAIDLGDENKETNTDSLEHDLKKIATREHDRRKYKDNHSNNKKGYTSTSTNKNNIRSNTVITDEELELSMLQKNSDGSQF